MDNPQRTPTQILREKIVNLAIVETKIIELQELFSWLINNNSQLEVSFNAVDIKTKDAIDRQRENKQIIDNNGEFGTMLMSINGVTMPMREQQQPTYTSQQIDKFMRGFSMIMLRNTDCAKVVQEMMGVLKEEQQELRKDIRMQARAIGKQNLIEIGLYQE